MTDEAVVQKADPSGSHKPIHLRFIITRVINLSKTRDSPVPLSGQTVALWNQCRIWSPWRVWHPALFFSGSIQALGDVWNLTVASSSFPYIVKNTGGSPRGILYFLSLIHHPCMHAASKMLQSCPTLCDPVDCSLPGSSVHRIRQARYWCGSPCPPPGDLPDPGIEPESLMSTPLTDGFFTTSATWKASTPPCQLKKCATWELRVKVFYLGQNEDCSLGDSSEKLLQRCRGQVQ